MFAEQAVPEVAAVPPPAVAPARLDEPVREAPTVSQVPARRVSYRDRPAPVALAAAPPTAVVARLSLGRIDTSDREHAANLRVAVDAVLEPVRSCCESLMQEQADLKGTVSAAVSIRDARVTAVNIDSALRDTRLRMCFRKRLMGLAVAGAEAPFDARLEFFLVRSPGSSRSR